MFEGVTRPAVIAHRGSSTHAPENTLAAFTLAADQGADAIEFDVKLSADGHVVVMHDAKVDRTTDGSGRISRLMLADLRALDAGSWFSERFRGERVPTLEQVFAAVGRRIYMNIELTNYDTPADSLVPKVVELVRKHGLEERVLFSSFFSRNLKRARRLLPAAALGLLAAPGLLGFWARTFGWRGDYQALHPHRSDVNAGLVERLHAAGKRVHVWTVNRDVEVKQMLAMEVDALFTDDPALVCRLAGRDQ